MKQLRESDIRGAPLPFQAAASSSKACFEIVCATIRKTLGKSELRTQLKVRPIAIWQPLVSFAPLVFSIMHNTRNARKFRPGPNIASCVSCLIVSL